MTRLLMALISLITISGCASSYTQQRIDNAVLISPGMNKQEVASVMGGAPAKAQFSGNVEEWHYCSTGYSSDEFVAVFFHEGEVIAMRPYLVTLRDAGGASGDCERFVRMGNYREPDEVREYRFR